MSKLSVYIEGDRSVFKSKAGIDKFKTFVKENETFNLLELSNKYLNENYLFELVNKTENEIKINIVKKDIIKDDKREQLKKKINEMKKQRTNTTYPRAKTSEDSELYKEYDKANKLSNGNMPDINNILKNPEEYKEALEILLNNPIMDKLGKNHPLTKCYKLLGEKIGISNKSSVSIVPNDNTESEEEAPKLVTSTNDEDTEEED